MIKILLFILIILLAAIGLLLIIHQDPGYVVVSYNHWLMATSFWVAVVSLFLLFVFLYYLIRIFKNIIAIPKFLSRSKKLSNAKQYQAVIAEAMHAFTSGDYEDAEKYFVKSAKNAENPAENYLMAAQAAHLQDKIKTRDKYLEKAKSLGADLSKLRFVR